MVHSAVSPVWLAVCAALLIEAPGAAALTSHPGHSGEAPPSTPAPPPDDNRVTSPQVRTLNASVVGIYSDCTGRTALAQDGAYVDSCVPDVRYLVGHNRAGVFHPLHSLRVGDRVVEGGRTLRVVGLQDDWDLAGGFPSVPPGTIEQMQTCMDGQDRRARIVSLG